MGFCRDLCLRRWVVWMGALALWHVGCGGRSVGGQVAEADAEPADAGQPDAGKYCGGDPLSWDVYVNTDILPQYPVDHATDYVLEGRVVYVGAVTEPLTDNPNLDKESRIQHADGSTSVLQYHLPSGLELPMREGGEYIVTYRRKITYDGNGAGLVIRRPTSGRPPLLFVGEKMLYGRVFHEDDPLTAPLRVYRENDPDCPTYLQPDPCEGNTVFDYLVFDSSTGGITSRIPLYQGEQGTLPVFGVDHAVANVQSIYVEWLCGDVRQPLAYLAISSDH